MTALELQNQLIRKITEINDITLLKALMTILESKTGTNQIILPEELKEIIAASQEEVRKGKYTSHESLEDEVMRWANEK